MDQLIGTAANVVLTFFESFTRVLGPVMIVVGMLLITLVSWSYFDAIMPALGVSPFSVLWLLCTAVGLWLLCNLLFNYYKCIFTSPGHPSRHISPMSGVTVVSDATASQPGGSVAQYRGHRHAAHEGESLDDERASLLAQGSASAHSHGPTVSASSTSALAGNAPSLASSNSVSGSGAAAGAGALASAATGVGGGSGGTAGGASDGGTSNKSSAAGRSSSVSTSQTNATARQQRSGQSSVCRKCDSERPPRTHHCQVCKRCILKMDHHCPWINNCVGWGNYPYFFRLLFYLWTGCMYVVVLSVVPASNILFASQTDAPAAAAAGAAAVASTGGGGVLSGGGGGPLSPSSRLTLSFAVCVALGIAISALFAWHVYLLLTNQTSIEYMGNSSERSYGRHRGQVFRNPYDLGWRRNLASVFGSDSPFRWMLPHAVATGDGRRFDVFGGALRP